MPGVSEIADELPTDIDALQTLVATAHAQRDAAIAECDRLRHLLRQLQRAQFGRRSEKLDPDQLALVLEDVEQAVAQTETAGEIPRSTPSAPTSAVPAAGRLPP